MADNRPIGVFDSGIGGLTVLREIINRIPGESTVYFGDNGRTPYGTKSHDTIVKYSLQDMKFLESKDVKMIVIACSTASAHSFKTLAKYSKVPVVEMVYPSSKSAIDATRNGKIGIIATGATVSGGTYVTAINELADGKSVEVCQQACPMFVPLAEEGWWDNEIAHLTAQKYLESLKDFGVDTVVLGCTHFPLLANTIGDIMGLDNHAVLTIGKEVMPTTVELIGKLLDEESSNVTLFYGDGVTEDDANALLAVLEEKYPNVDASVVFGGQPVYYYLISVE